MILYLFKSSLCLLILWGIYRLFLESEKLHVFNRFYLLVSLVFAFAVPMINIELQTETVADNSLVLFKKSMEAQPTLLQAMNPTEPMKVSKSSSWSDYLIVLSTLISLFFLVRFLNNLTTIHGSIRRNPTIKWQGAKLVLVDEKILPYTFLNYIFINKHHYENALIEPELFSHELTHVRQKHSLDVIFIELLRIVLWFNPLLYLFKHAIQLNHEFLADEAVNKTYDDVPAYQYLLFSKASQASGLTLTSNLNFQITKKRLLMMTKITSKSTAFMKTSVCFPMFAVLIFCFAKFELQAQEPTALKPKPPIVKSDKLTKEDVNFKKGKIMVIEKEGKFYHKNYDELTEEEKGQNLKVLYLEKVVPTKEVMEKWKDSKMYGIWINEKRVPNNHLSKYKPSDISSFFTSKLEKNAINYGKHYYQVDLMTNEYYEKVYIKGVIETPILFIDKREKKGK